MGKKVKTQALEYDVLSLKTVARLRLSFVRRPKVDLEAELYRELVIPMSYIPLLAYMTTKDSNFDARDILAWLKTFFQYEYPYGRWEDDDKYWLFLTSGVRLSFLKTEAYALNPAMMADRSADFLCLECATVLRRMLSRAGSGKCSEKIGIIVTPEDVVVEAMAAAEKFRETIYDVGGVENWFKALD